VGDGGAGWVGIGRVRARQLHDHGMQIVVDGLTTQSRYYKPLIYEFFRKEWRRARPAWGEYAVEIVMEYTGDPPWLDLDNLAKALLDAIKGYAFHDDAQVGRLLVERREGERERIEITVTERRGGRPPLPR
jgi:crossover junction endodeoxyribonuclease RusA